MPESKQSSLYVMLILDLCLYLIKYESELKMGSFAKKKKEIWRKSNWCAAEKQMQSANLQSTPL